MDGCVFRPVRLPPSWRLSEGLLSSARSVSSTASSFVVARGSRGSDGVRLGDSSATALIMTDSCVPVRLPSHGPPTPCSEVYTAEQQTLHAPLSVLSPSLESVAPSLAPLVRKASEDTPNTTAAGLGHSRSDEASPCEEMEELQTELLSGTVAGEVPPHWSDPHRPHISLVVDSGSDLLRSALALASGCTRELSYFEVNITALRGPCVMVLGLVNQQFAADAVSITAFSCSASGMSGM